MGSSLAWPISSLGSSAPPGRPGNMAHFGGCEGITQGPVSVVRTHAGTDVGGAPDMEWDLDVDAFLDDYLKELGPEVHSLDHLGNFGIDFTPAMAALPRVLDAWGTSVPNPSTAPTDSTAQQAGTTLTSQLWGQVLDSQGPSTLPQSAPSEGVQQPARVTRARKGTASAESGGSRGVGGKETKKDLDMKKHLALQEKNRRAQRRFRERQKQRVTELEDQVAHLMAQLQAALSANATPLVHSPLAAATAHPMDSDADPMQQNGCVVKHDAAASPRAVVGAQLPAAHSLPPSDKDAPLLMEFEEALMLTVREGYPVQLGAQELADMTPAELARHYKAYVNELAGILVESDNSASHATQERVRRLVDEVCQLSTRTALCNPPGSKHFTLTKVDEVSNEPADTHVPQITRALNISQQQRRQLGQLRGLFLQKLARVSAERQDINGQLAGAVPSGTGSRQLASRYLVAHDCQRRLRESLRQEHILVLDFVSTIYKHVFSSQQVAQFMIQSYPWTPDCLALCTWVAAEDGDAEALSMLAAEAQCKQQAAAQAQAQAQAGSNDGAPQTSGGSGSGNTLAGIGGGPTTPTSGAMPPVGGPVLVPSVFAAGGGGGGGQSMFGQPAMVAPGTFNPLLHAPGAGADTMNNLMGQWWGSAGSGTSVQSGMHLLATRGSGCLAGACGGGKVGLLGELGGSGPVVPISPNMATMSSANVA